MRRREPRIDRGYALRCTLYGAVGFGAGGALGGSLFLDPDSVVFPLGMAVMGLFGGASLGLAFRSWTKAGLLALVGAFSFALGSRPVLFVVAMVMTERMVFVGQAIGAGLGLLLFGAVQGLAGTIAMLLVLKRLGNAGRPLAAGSVGFAIGAQSALGMVVGWPIAATLALWGTIGGGVLGAALGYFEEAKSHSANLGQ